MPKKFLKHWRLLVDGIYCLLKFSLTYLDIAVATDRLNPFAEQTAAVHGEEHVVYNAHQLTYLAQCAAEYGPLWQTSAFPFEGHNQNLLKLFSGTTYVCTQIAHSFTMLASLPKLFSHVDTVDLARVKRLVEKQLDGYPLTCNITRLENTIAFGIPVVRQLTSLQQSLLLPLCNCLSDSEEFYDRILIRGKTFCTGGYGKNFKLTAIQWSSSLVKFVQSYELC
jgi:hypothetical protein